MPKVDHVKVLAGRWIAAHPQHGISDDGAGPLMVLPRLSRSDGCDAFVGSRAIKNEGFAISNNNGVDKAPLQSFVVLDRNALWDNIRERSNASTLMTVKVPRRKDPYELRFVLVWIEQHRTVMILRRSLRIVKVGERSTKKLMSLPITLLASLRAVRSRLASRAILSILLIADDARLTGGRVRHAGGDSRVGVGVATTSEKEIVR